MTDGSNPFSGPGDSRRFDYWLRWVLAARDGQAFYLDDDPQGPPRAAGVLLAPEICPIEHLACSIPGIEKSHLRVTGLTTRN